MIRLLKKNQRGISIVLSMVILAAIIGLVLVVADVAFRVTKSGEAVSSSEVAFFAAETAAEVTIYDIEANGRGLDLPDLFNQPLEGVSGATWDRKVRLATTTPGLCGAAVPKPVCSNDPGGIFTTNELYVTLDDNQSFQMDLNIEGAEYPSNIRLLGGGGGSQVVVSSSTAQYIETRSNFTIPPDPLVETLTPELGYRFRIVNETGGTATYTIRPQGSNVPFPLGLNVSTIGRNLNTERRIDVRRPAWLIY